VGGIALTSVFGASVGQTDRELDSPSVSNTAEVLSTRLDDIAATAHQESADPQTLTAIAGARLALKRMKNSASTYLSDAEEESMQGVGSFLQKTDWDEHLDVLSRTLDSIMEEARNTSAHPRTLEVIQKFQKAAPLFSYKAPQESATADALEKMKAVIQSISAGSDIKLDTGRVADPVEVRAVDRGDGVKLERLSLSVSDKLGGISEKASEGSADPKTLKAIRQIETLYQKSKGSETSSADHGVASYQSARAAVGEKLQGISQHAQTHFADGKTLDDISKIQQAYHKATEFSSHAAHQATAKSERNFAFASKLDGISRRAQQNSAASETLAAIEQMQGALASNTVTTKLQTTQKSRQHFSKKSEVLSKLDLVSRNAGVKSAHPKTLEAIKHIRDVVEQ
jgi:hypothetical protein